MPSFIIVGYVWRILGRKAKKPPPNPSAAPKKSILNRVKDLINNIRNNTISETDAKKDLNTLNETKNAEIIKYKKHAPRHKKLLNLLSDFLDIILTDKTLESERQEEKNENENEKVESKKVESRKEENENVESKKDEDEHENEDDDYDYEN